MFSRKFLFVLIAIFSIWTFVARLLPHAANMTPVGALALFAGVYLPRRWAYLVPLAALLVSDAWFGGYELSVMFSVYGSFIAITFIGLGLRKNSFAVRSIVGSALSATLFFLVTNFAVWAATPWYAKDFTGLMTSYTLALPFWRNMFVGDIVYTGAFFGIAAATAFFESRITNYELSKKIAA